jgi:hypothetical protein
LEFRAHKNGRPYPIKSAKQRDLENNKLGLDPQKTDELVDKLTALAMEQRREQILHDPRIAVPKYMREDPTTPLILEVPFGPDTRKLIDPNDSRYVDAKTYYDNEKGKFIIEGDTRHYEIPSHNMVEFEKFEAEQNKLPKDKAFPMHYSNGVGFRVIPYGDISIPAEQERKTIPLEKRDWENGKLKSKAYHNHQKDKDAEEIAKELLLDEGSSRFVNKVTRKIRPPKPVRSDFASIITAEKGFDGVISKETVFVVGEHNKPEYVKVMPLSEFLKTRK